MSSSERSLEERVAVLEALYRDSRPRELQMLELIHRVWDEMHAEGIDLREELRAVRSELRALEATDEWAERRRSDGLPRL